MLSASQAAKKLNVHINTIRRWIGEGELPASRTPGGHFRIDPDDLNAMTGRETIQPHYKVDAVISAARAVVDDPSPRNILRLGVVTANLAAATKYDDRKETNGSE